jgi:undecaprenyl diphosphate synthase
MTTSFVKQSSLTVLRADRTPLHVAIIMDGNGRWAARRGRPRAAGHREGARAVRRAVEAAPALGVTTLTLYAFSGDNWRRPSAEVTGLMRLFERYLRTETARCVENDVRLTVIGRRDRLAPALVAAIGAAELATADGRRLHVRVAIDYSARDLIARAAARLAGPHPADASDGEALRHRFAAAMGEAMHAGAPSEDVDLLVRTGGEQRLSDFLLWECAYAELVFSERMWPEFGRDELAQAVAEYHARERRFGGLSPARPAAALHASRGRIGR